VTVSGIALTLVTSVIVLSCTPKIVLPFRAIVDLPVERSISWQGLHIRQTQPGVSQRLIIWSSNVEALEGELLEGLRRRSEPVDGDRKQ
jgi:hypothetical protein